MSSNLSSPSTVKVGPSPVVKRARPTPESPGRPGTLLRVLFNWLSTQPRRRIVREFVEEDDDEEDTEPGQRRVEFGQSGVVTNTQVVSPTDRGDVVLSSYDGNVVPGWHIERGGFFFDSTRITSNLDFDHVILDSEAPPHLTKHFLETLPSIVNKLKVTVHDLEQLTPKRRYAEIVLYGGEDEDKTLFGRKTATELFNLMRDNPDVHLRIDSHHEIPEKWFQTELIPLLKIFKFVDFSRVPRDETFAYDLTDEENRLLHRLVELRRYTGGRWWGINWKGRVGGLVGATLRDHPEL